MTQMTNREAIEILTDRARLADYLNSELVDGIDIMAVNMAIAALEKQEQKTTEKRLPCSCGRKRLETWWSWDNDSWYLKCPVCGKKSSPVKKKSDLNTAWNNAVRGEEHGAD